MAPASSGNPPPAGLARSAARRDAPEELSELDFSAADAPLALAECAELVEVREGGVGAGAVYEEAAVLYANGNACDAGALLEAALAGDAEAAGEGVWMMLLDLYRLTGQRERFESRVLDYATRFERSPPPWANLSDAPARPRASAAPLVNLAGNLGSQVAAQLQQLVVIGQRSGAIRIDLKRVRGADEPGCALLLDAVLTLARERVRVSLLNGEGLVATLAAVVEPGRAQRRDTWLLLLELLQHTGEHERFDELAVEYAVTFEESPPSWEVRAVAPPSAGGPDDASGRPVGGGTPCLEGELTAAAGEPLRRLAEQAAECDELVVDCSRLRRLDFVSAGMLFNVLSTLRAQGKLVHLQHVNAMVAALLRVMGVDQVAQVRLRG